uniref:Dexamethasone-induced Ras-related protein 1 n=1 Tax=Ursus maritimus TaxID=29073 RepID=A0A452TEK2_URSMA
LRREPEAIVFQNVFILVFSLDNRDSFEEVQRLKQQILDTKSCLKNKTKENVDVPLVICGNKGDRDFYREVEQREIEQLVGDDPQRCAYFEISAKKNSSLDQMFRALFAMAKLPSEMSPDLHRKVSVQYCDALPKKALRSRGSGGGGRQRGRVLFPSFSSVPGAGLVYSLGISNMQRLLYFWSSSFLVLTCSRRRCSCCCCCSGLSWMPGMVLMTLRISWNLVLRAFRSWWMSGLSLSILQGAEGSR